MRTLSLVLDNIRSAYNVGSLLRSADGAGVAHVYLCGTTPPPIDRFGRARNDIAKVALGAEKSVLWSYHKSTIELLRELQEKDIELIALEQTPQAIAYQEKHLRQESALVVGEETQGISPEVLAMCTTHLFIPMRGKKESLNVGVAAGVALYSLLT